MRASQVRARIGAELVREQSGRGRVQVQCLRIPAVGVQCAHDRRDEVLGQRVLAGKGLQFRQDDSRASQPQFGLGPPDGDVDALPGKPIANPVGPLAADVGQRRAVPEAQSLP